MKSASNSYSTAELIRHLRDHAAGSGEYPTHYDADLMRQAADALERCHGPNTLPDGMERAAKIARGYLHVHPIAKQIAQVIEADAKDMRQRAPKGEPIEIESLKVTLGCCLALMSQSGNPSCEEMARRIPFTIKNGEPYALFSAPCATGSLQEKS